MSLKSIEMQIALPRTQDAGKIQEQLQQRGQIQHEQATHQMHKEEEKKRISVNRHNQKEKPALSQNGQPTQGQYTQNNKKAPSEVKSNQPQPHPYKGSFVDFSG